MQTALSTPLGSLRRVESRLSHSLRALVSLQRPRDAGQSSESERGDVNATECVRSSEGKCEQAE